MQATATPQTRQWCSPAGDPEELGPAPARAAAADDDDVIHAEEADDESVALKSKAVDTGDSQDASTAAAADDDVTVADGADESVARKSNAAGADPAASARLGLPSVGTLAHCLGCACAAQPVRLHVGAVLVPVPRRRQLARAGLSLRWRYAPLYQSRTRPAFLGR